MRRVEKMNIHLKTKGSKVPKNDYYYIIANNGFFLHKDNDMIETIQPVETIPSLDFQMEKMEFKYPSLAREQTLNVIAFFYRAYKKFHGESIVLLHHQKNNGYLVHPPHQKVSRAALEYSADERFKNNLLVGSIHSHGRFMAYHSEGHEFSDHNDEMDFDGIHITIGNINSNIFTISCSIMVDGERYILNPLKYLKGIKEEKIVKVKTRPLEANQGNSQFNLSEYLDTCYWAPRSGDKYWYKLIEPENKLWNKIRNSKFFIKTLGIPKIEKKEYLKHPQRLDIPFFFSLDLPEGQTINDIEIPKKWLNRLKRYSIIERIKSFFQRIKAIVEEKNENTKH